MYRSLHGPFKYGLLYLNSAREKEILSVAQFLNG